MVKELDSEELNETVESGKMHNITSKAGRLAMELAAEKKRLAQELEELQGEYDDIKPLTPTGTRDWYVKWSSMILGVLVGTYSSIYIANPILVKLNVNHYTVVKKEENKN